MTASKRLGTTGYPKPRKRLSMIHFRVGFKISQCPAHRSTPNLDDAIIDVFITRQFATYNQFLPALRTGEPAGVADADEAGRQNVQGKRRMNSSGSTRRQRTIQKSQNARWHPGS